MTAEKTYQSLRADMSSRIEQKLKELQALTADDIIDMYKAEAEKLSVLDGKYPGTGGIRTFITGRDKFTYDFIDLDKYYIKDEVDEMLEKEKKEREDADEALDERMTDWEDRLEKEILERKEADADLLDQIDKEVERAKEAEADLRQKIYDETARAKGVEEDLQQQITDEIARAKEAEKDLQDQLNKEIERATGAEEYLQDQLDEEIARAKEAEETETSEREKADNRLVDWAKEKFVVTIDTKGDSPLTLETSYHYDNDGYKLYEIHGTVDCYSKGEIDELADKFKQTDSLLQSNIDNVLSGVTDLSNSIQGQLNTITSNYVVTIGTNCTYPLTLTTDKNGNNYTISGHVDCYSKDEVDSLISGVSSSLGDYYTKSEVDDLINSIKSSIPSQGITSVTANSSSSILTASCSTDNGSATITYGISDSDLRDWLDNNGYGEGGGGVDLSDYYTKEDIDKMFAELSSEASVWIGYGNLSISSNTSIDRGSLYPSSSYGTPKVGDAVLYFYVNYNDPQAVTLAIVKSVSDNTVVVDMLYSWDLNSGSSTDLSNYYTKEEINELLDGIKAGDVDLSDYQKKLNYYHENVDEDSDVIFAHITANSTTYTLSDGTSVTSPNLAQYRLQCMKSALSKESVWWTTDYEGKEVTVLQLVVKCDKETKQPLTSFNAYPDFFEWTVDQEYGSDYSQKLVLDRNGLWLNSVKVGGGDGSDVSSISCTGDDYLTLTASPSTGNVNITGTVDIDKIGPNVFPSVSNSIPTDITLNSNQLYTGSISSNTDISFHTTGSVAGAEVHIIIEAKSAATVSLSGSSAVFTDGYSSIDVASGKYLEINAIYDGSKIYVRSGYSE